MQHRAVRCSSHWLFGCVAFVLACAQTPEATAPDATAPPSGADAAGSTHPAHGEGQSRTSPAEPAPVGAGTRGEVGATCGGIAGLGCKDSLFCDFPPSAQCGAADQTGTCQEKPQICTKIYKPVCGCDKKTYGNDCEARGAGVSIASEGEC